jgi:NADPH:quinone reductase-like Zn-dependent oxidoreductase
VVALDDDAEIAKLPLLDAVADTVGGEVIRKLYGKLRARGTIGSILGEPPGARERGFVVHALMTHPDAATLARYVAAVAGGLLVIPIAEKMPLAQAAEAQTLAEKKHPRGKVLLLG